MKRGKRSDPLDPADEALGEFLAAGFVHVSTVRGMGCQHIVERDRNLIVEILGDRGNYSISVATVDQPTNSYDYDILRAALAGTAVGRALPPIAEQSAFVLDSWADICSLVETPDQRARLDSLQDERVRLLFGEDFVLG